MVQTVERLMELGYSLHAATAIQVVQLQNEAQLTNGGISTPNGSVWNTVNPAASINPTPITITLPIIDNSIKTGWIDLLYNYFKTYESDYDDEWIWNEFKNRALQDGRTLEFAEKHWDHFMTTKRATVKSKKPFLERTFEEAFSRHKFGRTEGEIGIEIEAEGKNLFNSPISYWSAVPDHSLRAVDGHPPIEYVLREPIKRSDVMPSLEYLKDRLRKAGSELVMSHRCSVHVHVNVQSMKMIEVLNFMALYYIFENLLIEWSGPERKGNLFCLRAQDADFQIELLVEALKKGSWDGVFHQDFRYAAMNATSLGKHGSLEFRSMKGNVDIDVINTWVDILLFLKDSASNFKNPEEVSSEFRKYGPNSFFKKVFQKKSDNKHIRNISNYPELNTMMWDSYRSMRDLCHAIDWDNPPKHMMETTGRKKASQPTGWGLSDPEEEQPYNEPEETEGNGF